MQAEARILLHVPPYLAQFHSALRSCATTRDETWQASYRFDIGAGAALVRFFAWLWLWLWLWLTRNAEEFRWSLQAQPYYYPVVSLFFASLLCLLAASRALAKWADNPICRFIATLSFGLYLWHYAVMEVMLCYFANDFHYAGVNDPLRFLGLNSIVLAATFAPALLPWHGIEQPVLKAVGRRYAKSEQQPQLPTSERTISLVEIERA